MGITTAFNIDRQQCNNIHNYYPHYNDYVMSFGRLDIVHLQAPKALLLRNCDTAYRGHCHASPSEFSIPSAMSVAVA